MSNGAEGPDQSQIIMEAIATEIVRESKLHLNLGQNTIVITEDKIRLCLNDHLRGLESRWGWVAPAAIFLTILITFVTTTFHDFYLKAPVWEAIFLVAEVLVFFWLVRSVIRALKAPSIEDVVSAMKRASASEAATGRSKS